MDFDEHAVLTDGHTCHGTTLITHGTAEVDRSATVIEDVEIRPPSIWMYLEEMVHWRFIDSLTSGDSTEKLGPLGQHNTLMADGGGESKRTACKSQAHRERLG